jgi:hypothetical protein
MLSEGLMGEGLGVGVIGAGYAGLVTVACLAHIDRPPGGGVRGKGPRAPKGAQQGGQDAHLEPGLEELVWRGVRAETLRPEGNIPWSC